MRTWLLFLFLFPFFLTGQEKLLLRENLDQAQIGDYLVIAQGKSYTLFHIFDKKPRQLTIEEVTIPSATACQEISSWRNWLAMGAPHNTSWVHYQIDLNSARLENYYSFTKNGWFIVPDADNFLQTLLQLELELIPENSRKKTGRAPRRGKPDSRQPWQPTMVVNGQIIEGVRFNAYQTTWPKDGGLLSGKTLELYLPETNSSYPAYFPYWLQVKGILGPAKVRIVDSGSGLHSPKTTPIR